MFLGQLFSSEFAHEVDKLVYGDEFISPEVERLGDAGVHETRQTLDAIADIAEAARLTAIPPDLNCPSRLCLSNLAANCSGRLLPPTLICAEGSVDVVEANNSGIQAVVSPVVIHQLFGEEFL